MPQFQSVARRLTHRYVGTWRHLDQWEDAGRIKVLGGTRHYNAYEREAYHLRTAARIYPFPSYYSHRRGGYVYPKTRPLGKAEIRRRMREYEPDASVGTLSISRVVAYGFKGMTAKEICRAIEDEFSSHGCSHEYDCCGCRSYTARVEHVKGSEFVLRITTSYNF